MILRKAVPSELTTIWEILQQAINQRKQDGSDQWQNGYPNEETVYNDIATGVAYVLVENNGILAYAAVIFGIEAAYNDIKGKWLTDADEEYVTVHRVATSDAVKGKGVATWLFKMIEAVCLEHQIYSIKVDTNFDNMPMLKILEKSGYTYCGEIFFSGASRKAYEKVLSRS